MQLPKEMLPKSPRIYDRLVKDYDRQFNTSLRREIEMIVDRLVDRSPCHGYNIQFWTDMTVYGLREAIVNMYTTIIPEDSPHKEEDMREFMELFRIGKKILG